MSAPIPRGKAIAFLMVIESAIGIALSGPPRPSTFRRIADYEAAAALLGLELPEWWTDLVYDAATKRIEEGSSA